MRIGYYDYYDDYISEPRDVTSPNNKKETYFLWMFER